MKPLKLFLLLTVFYFSAAAQGYKIEVQIKGVENQDLILGYHKGDKLIPYDTVRTDAKGYGVFKGKKKLREGLYFIFLPSTTYFDFLIGDDQKFLIKNDTSDLIKNLKITGSQDNEIFIAYENFFFSKNKELQEINRKLKNAKGKEKQKLEKQREEIIAQVDDYFKDISEKYPDLYVTAFIKATREPEIPKNLKNDKQKYKYYRNHYFDNFDYGDPRLLYTPFYFSKIDYFLDKVIPPIPDTIITEIDKILDATKKDEELYKNVLSHLLNKYIRSQMMIAENIYVHLGEIYIRDATWSEEKYKKTLKKRIDKKKNCLIGMKAHNMTLSVLPPDSAGIEKLRIPLKDLKQNGLVIEKDTSLNMDQKVEKYSVLIAEYLRNFPSQIMLDTISSKYTILWFMSPDCSHCRHETPLFYKTYLNELKDKDVTVITIYLEKGTEDWRRFASDIGKWLDFIQKNKFDKWYNAWNPFANYRFYYDINSTPILYLLDKDKKIIAKRIGYEQAKEMILGLEAADKKK